VSWWRRVCGAQPVVSAPDPAVLDRIAEPGVGAARWIRPLDQAEGDAFAAWAGGPAVSRVTVTAADGPHPAWRELVESAPSGPARSRLETDLALLVPWVARQLKTRTLRVALRTVDTDACSKYHCDWIRLRTIVTYAGPGTEWTVEKPPAGAVDWTPKAGARCGPGDALALVGLAFRGDPARTRPTVWHRSPPIQGSGLRRLVLTLDDLPTTDGA